MDILAELRFRLGSMRQAHSLHGELERLREENRKLKHQRASMRKRLNEQREHKARTVFFVVGSGKSGTTWLMHMLNAHPEIMCRGEGRIFNRQWFRQYLRDANANIAPRSLYGALHASEDLRLWAKRSPWGFKKNPEALIDKITRASIDHIFDWWLTESKLANRTQHIVGDKTPFMPGANVVEEIARVYPEAKVIHIIRDGRDVEVSWTHHRWNRSEDRGGVQVLSEDEIERRDAYESGDHARLEQLGMFEEQYLRKRALQWKEMVGEVSETGPKMLGNNYAQIRYEDLLEAPNAQLQKLLELLGASTDAEAIEHCIEQASFENLSGGRSRGEENSAKFYRKGVAGDWKETFTNKDTRIYEDLAGDLLEKYGYERVT